MKNTLYLICFVSIAIATTGCNNNEVDNPLPPCDPDLIGQDTEFYFNQTGKLMFTDTFPHYKLTVPAYFINSEDVSYFLLIPCNLPVSEYNLAIRDTIDILFSGTLMLLPPTATASSLQFKLTKIQKISANE